MKSLIITYTLTCPAATAHKEAEAVALEQSVELPPEAVTDQEVAWSTIPDIIELTPLTEIKNSLRQHRLRLAFSGKIIGNDIPQFLNVLFGNISLKKGLRVDDINLSPQISRIFPGPSTGIKGIRTMCGTPSGPLLCTALKPLGSSPSALKKMAKEFSRAGIQIIKDDHGFADQSSAPFKERVKAIQGAIKESGSHTLYFPNITGPREKMENHIAFALKEGVKGFLVSPFLVGLDTFRYLRATYPVTWMAHPSFSGAFFADRTQGITPGLLLGTIFRLLGADMSIYPHVGGRFNFTDEDCRDISRRLREERKDSKPSFPVPAGGISLSSVKKIHAFYGDDVMFLVGGSLYLENGGLESSTRALLALLKQPLTDKNSEEVSDNEKEIPSQPTFSLPEGVTRQIMPGRWQGIKRNKYKAEGKSFQGISRTEIYVPDKGEAGFNVRYFEIVPGGYSSFEKHQHIHLVIGVCGKGEICIDDSRQTILPHDIVFIPPNRPHQLRNSSDKPFGFYCTVDHIRDKPFALEEESLPEEAN